MAKKRCAYERALFDEAEFAMHPKYGLVHMTSPRHTILGDLVSPGGGGGGFPMLEEASLEIETPRRKSPAKHLGKKPAKKAAKKAAKKR